MLINRSPTPALDPSSCWLADMATETDGAAVSAARRALRDEGAR